MLTIFGFLIIAFLIYFLLRDKMSPMVALIVVPFVGILLFWLVAAGTSLAPSKNYSFLLSKEEAHKVLLDFGKENGYEILSDKAFASSYTKALSDIKLKPNAKLESIKVDEAKLKSFYKSRLMLLMKAV